MDYSSDIAGELNDWLERVSGAARLGPQPWETAEIEVELVRRAAAEIKRLGEKLRRTTRSIDPAELNASNDE